MSTDICPPGESWVTTVVMAGKTLIPISRCVTTETNLTTAELIISLVTGLILAGLVVIIAVTLNALFTRRH